MRPLLWVFLLLSAPDEEEDEADEESDCGDGADDDACYRAS